MKKRILIVLYIFSFSTLFAQNSDRNIEIYRIQKPPKIDGYLNEKVWQNTALADGFIQFEPYNGKSPSRETLVKIAYTNNALFLGAVLYDNPDSISTNLCKRDGGFEANTDLFVVIINPYNDGINSFEFTVTSSGVQNDLRHAGTNNDLSWDAVWKSEVTMTDSGWIVEMEIPFSALRLPKTTNQIWGFHLFRHINRFREWDSWNYVDQENEDFVSQDGTISGINNIDPPLRLSVTPYLSTYFEKNAENKSWGSKFKGGMDLKYGINESFTLDMILIPDFGQVQSDDKVLNLSPFEINYEEKRPFFMEGNELFTKAGIFYSRRIGSTPKYFNNVYEQLDSTEIVLNNPNETPLLNATKLSGRLPNGLGIGVFNAITANTEAEIKDTLSGEKRNIQTQPFTNYNIFVFDQNLKNNSFISIINTNLKHANSSYMANVSGTEFKLANKEQTYAMSGGFNVSNVNENTDSLVTGYKYYIGVEKTKGNFLFNIIQNVESDKYNPNDMGFLYNNNEVSDFLILRYNIYKPFWRLLNWRSSYFMAYKKLYNPRVFTQLNINFNSHVTFRNYLSTGFYASFVPIEIHDYFEARENERLFIDSKNYGYGAWISSDYRKTFALDIRTNLNFAEKYEQNTMGFVISPRLRPNNQILLVYELRKQRDLNDIGYTTKDDNGDIIFGKRNLNTIINTLNLSYTFTNKASLSFRLRHYWVRLNYNQFYILEQSGYLSNELGYDYYNTSYDYNYNSFNIDLLFQWNFAPGSELSVVWKNIIDNPDVPMENEYFANLNNIFASSLNNNLSVKVLYYFDYNYFKKGIE
ncbi:MAG: carbohydrate binding family 9 domain-containing protein [Chlorobi bacterium]|nr:carbohydrate binding family 9 domain-containing protein [Chlorobiota bacterium]